MERFKKGQTVYFMRDHKITPLRFVRYYGAEDQMYLQEIGTADEGYRGGWFRKHIYGSKFEVLVHQKLGLI